MITSPDQGLSNIACNLLSLPEHILSEILKHIDIDGLSALAQTCRVFFHLAGSPSLWQQCPYYRHRSEDLLSLAARLCLSRALHLPPQAFRIDDDMGRSLKFPVAIPLFNLRRLLCSPHVDEFSDRAASAITDQIGRASWRRAQNRDASLWPADIFLFVRSDRFSMRFALRASTATHVMLLDLHRFRWPTRACAEEARAEYLLNRKVQESPLLAKGALPAMKTDHMWAFFDIYCTKPSTKANDQVSKPKVTMLAHVQGLKDVVATRDSLQKAAKQLVALLGWTNMNLHTAYDNVERWLGPVEELCLQVGSKDVELLLHLRRIKRVLRVSAKLVVKDVVPGQDSLCRNRIAQKRLCLPNYGCEHGCILRRGGPLS
ncbi:g7515 [Coccomyxa elongata]